MIISLALLILLPITLFLGLVYLYLTDKSRNKDQKLEPKYKIIPKKKQAFLRKIHYKLYVQELGLVTLTLQDTILSETRSFNVFTGRFSPIGEKIIVEYILENSNNLGALDYYHCIYENKDILVKNSAIAAWYIESDSTEDVELDGYEIVPIGE